MKNIKIGKKFLISFGIVIVLLLATAVNSITSMETLSKSYTTFHDGPFKVTSLSADMIKTLESACKNLAFSFIEEDPKRLETYIETCNTELQKLQTSADEIALSFTGDKSLLDDVTDILKNESVIRNRIINLSRKGYNENAYLVYKQEYETVLSNLTSIIDEVSNQSNTSVDKFYSEGQAVQNQSLILLIIFTGVAFVLTLIIALYLTKILTRPILEIEEAANRMANGDLNSSIKYKSKDELGHLSDSLNSMMSTLRGYMNDLGTTLNEISKGNFDISTTSDFKGDFVSLRKYIDSIVIRLSSIMGKIAISSEQVYSSSSQVSSGAQALSQGATQQASSVEELSATIQEISSKIKETAKNSERAREEAISANSYVENGNSQMLETISAMNEISESSGKIRNIIKTIEDIAFQTNILALNAAVEAARAGESGKGFAVVADEVRNLAAKSGEAAKDTTKLIQSSIAAIERGTNIANDAATALTKIVDSVNRIQDGSIGIADASEQQSGAVVQISLGVEQISLFKPIPPLHNRARLQVKSFQLNPSC